MLRSMYAGISGMKGFQSKLDVVGNNISNVNTNGFKKGRVTFQDMLSQTERGAEAAADDWGGMNPMQVGLGSQVGSIDDVDTQGFLESTGRSLDLAIEGDGMFRLDAGNEGSYYTRAGNFYLDDEGSITNADGYYVMDENDEEITIPEDAQSFSIAQNGEVTYVDANEETEIAGAIGLSVFPNTEGLTKLGDNLFAESLNSGEAQDTVPGDVENGAGELASSTLEMSNVDLAEEFSEMITSQRGFQANTRIITTSDEILQELVNLKR